MSKKVLPLPNNDKRESEIKSFLSDFKQKMKIWDVIFRDDRGKNFKTLSTLEIRPIDRKKILEELDIFDYSGGPFEDTLYKGSAMWVFGKIIKEQEIYIKISLGEAGSSVICISFHFAENKMTYPFKKQKI